MSVSSASLSAGAEELVLERGALRLELVLRPFSLTLRRKGRRLIRAGEVWVAEGEVHDRFIAFTEGVVPDERLRPLERAQRASLLTAGDDGLELAVLLAGGRTARLKAAIPSERLVTLRLDADGTPLRLAFEWDRRSEERLVGLGARHGTQFDQVGRSIQLGADRRYTGPDCPTELLSQGGIPQGDCAPVP